MCCLKQFLHQIHFLSRSDSWKFLTERCRLKYGFPRDITEVLESCSQVLNILTFKKLYLIQFNTYERNMYINNKIIVRIITRSFTEQPAFHSWQARIFLFAILSGLALKPNSSPVHLVPGAVPLV
jgi:hypothetical protein